MNNNLKQLYISGILGDGHLKASGAIMFSCIHGEYMEWKKELAGGIGSEVYEIDNKGYKEDGRIFKYNISQNEIGKSFLNKNVEDYIEDLDELGIALWLYDDGSLHKKNLFYNINTHSFSREIEEDVLIPKLNSFGICPKITTETKKDGRCFSYLYVSKYKGAFVINDILNKYPLDCYKYKYIPKLIVDNYNYLRSKYKGIMVNDTSLSLMVKREDLKTKELFITKNGLLVQNKQSRPSISKHTLIL